MDIKKGFTQINNDWIEGQTISDEAFRTLVVLKSYQYTDNKIFPSIKTLSERRGKSKTTIINHLNELRNKNLIKSKRRGYSISNEYTLISQENNTNGIINGPKNFTSNVKETCFQKSNNFEPNKTTNNNYLINDQNILRGKEYEKAKEKLFNKLPWANKQKPPKKW